MLTVYKFVGDWGLPDLSPFVIKLETYLRMAGIPYETRVGDPNKAPKKKLPYIDDGRQKIADSSRIIAHLEESAREPLDRHLSAPQRALGAAIRALLEEHYYFVIVHVRWGTDEGMATYMPTMLRYCEAAGMPKLMWKPAIWFARRGLRQQAWLQGIGRHSHAEIMAIGQGHWTAIAELLGDKPFILGDRPSTIDATVYAFLASTIWAPFDNEIKRHALVHKNLVDYAERMRAAYWA